MIGKLLACMVICLNLSVWCAEDIDPRLKILQDFQARGEKDKEAIFTEILRTQDMCAMLYQHMQREKINVV